MLGEWTRRRVTGRVGMPGVGASPGEPPYHIEGLFDVVPDTKL